MEEKAQARGESALFILIFAGILIVVNIISIKLFFRLDLTRNRAHSLSAGSLRAVENLKDRMTVKAYFTKNLPPPFNTTEQYVRDLLDEYKSRSKGKMKVEFIDPSTEKLAEEARTAGIREVTHQVIEKDQAAEKKGFRGIQFIYMGDSKVIDVITDTEGLEYEITSKIKQLIGEKKSVAFLQGHKEPKTMSPPPENPYDSEEKREPAPLEGSRKLMTQFNVREIDLKKGEETIPEDIEGLLVIGPTEKIEEAELYRIDQFLMRGGNAAFFVDGITVDTSTGIPSTKSNDIGLDDFLKHFGITLRKDMVFDFQCDTVPIRGPFGLPLATRYPAWLLAKIEAGEHPTTFKLPVLTFPWASSLQIRKNPPAGNVKIEVLAKSTDKSWSEEGNVQLEPSQSDWRDRFQKSSRKGPFVLAAAVEGKFQSFFNGKEIPEKAKAGNKEKLNQAIKKGRILVAGSSQMVLDPIIQVLSRLHRSGDLPANQVFMLNTVDWLVQDEDLIAVRAKGVENPRLREVSPATRDFVKYGNIFAWPLLLIFAGIIRWVVRAKRGKRKIKESESKGENNRTISEEEVKEQKTNEK